MYSNKQQEPLLTPERKVELTKKLEVAWDDSRTAKFDELQRSLNELPLNDAQRRDLDTLALGLDHHRARLINKLAELGGSKTLTSESMRTLLGKLDCKT